MGIVGGSITWVQRYPVDSLQIYFAASLEIQEELISYGFLIPRSRDKMILTPVPIIYVNFQGWIKPGEPIPITIERLIPPEWLGLTPGDLGWREITRGGKRAFHIGGEEAYVNLGVIEDASTVLMDLDIKGYHLERTSIRGVNPDKWSNWAMLYIGSNYIDELIGKLGEFVGPVYASNRCRAVKEVQQGGKEVTYYLRVPVVDFSLCLGCFHLALVYLRRKAEEHCKLYPNLQLCRDIEGNLRNLRLRLRYSPQTKTFAKVGVAKVSGKRSQLMVKLSSTGPEMVIQGVLKPSIKGKARGTLIHCDHRGRKQYLALNLHDFYKALIATRSCLEKLPREP